MVFNLKKQDKKPSEICGELEAKIKKINYKKQNILSKFFKYICPCINLLIVHFFNIKQPVI